MNAAGQAGYEERSAIGDKLERCGKAVFRDDAPRELLRDFACAADGLYPLAGGALDQPAKFMEALSLFGEYTEAVDAVRRARERAFAELRAKMGGG